MGNPEVMEIPEDVLELLRKPSHCFIATLMSDGAPQLTKVWVDTDGEHVVINTVEGFAKLRNLERDPRVSVAVAHQADPDQYLQLRGRMVSSTTEGGAEHINQLAQKYLGRPYPWYGGRDQVRVIVRIAVDKVIRTRG